MFVNLTNHPSAGWSAEQLDAARKYGEIADVPFPAVETSASSEDVRILAGKLSRAVADMRPGAVLCQGEFTLAYNLVNALKRKGILVLAACSDRCVTEKNVDGTITKEAVFTFAGFREY